ncbi:MAG: hypothetical protein ACLQGP_18670 [Isosphaeraceae bacterium]
MSEDFRCDRCDLVQYARRGPVAHYTLPDGRSFFALHGVGWCPGCRSLTEVERIPDPAELNQHIDSVSRDPELGRFQNLIPYWETQIEWARLRRRPPRCLRCGSRDFLALIEVDGRFWIGEAEGRRVFQHPGCGGEFREQPSIDMIQHVPRELTVDGDFLEGD